MNNEDQDDSLLDWESALVAATAVDPITLCALDWNANAPVFASHHDVFPNLPGDSGDFRNEAPHVPLLNLRTTLGDGDNGPDLRRSKSLRHNEMEKDKKEETEDYCRRKRARSVEGHNMSEKRRRKRIRERLKALQALIPNSNKDIASMLDDAVRYLKLLKLQVEMMSFSYVYGGAQNLVQFERGDGGGDAYQGRGIPILPRGCIPSPHNMSASCYPPPMMSGFVPNLPPTMPMFPCLFSTRPQFSWPPAPSAATDYPDVLLIPSTFNDNTGECIHSAPEESLRHCGHC